MERWRVGVSGSIVLLIERAGTDYENEDEQRVHPLEELSQVLRYVTSLVWMRERSGQRFQAPSPPLIANDRSIPTK
jgi:hypothetical protein